LTPFFRKKSYFGKIPIILCLSISPDSTVILLLILFSLFFSWRAEPVKRKAKGAAAPEPAAEHGCGSSGGGDGGNGV
jgi:hypothetical protein